MDAEYKVWLLHLIRKEYLDISRDLKLEILVTYLVDMGQVTNQAGQQPK